MPHHHSSPALLLALGLAVASASTTSFGCGKHADSTACGAASHCEWDSSKAQPCFAKLCGMWTPYDVSDNVTRPTSCMAAPQCTWEPATVVNGFGNCKAKLCSEVVFADTSGPTAAEKDTCMNVKERGTQLTCEVWQDPATQAYSCMRVFATAESTMFLDPYAYCSASPYYCEAGMQTYCCCHECKHGSHAASGHEPLTKTLSAAPGSLAAEQECCAALMKTTDDGELEPYTDSNDDLAALLKDVNKRIASLMSNDMSAANMVGQMMQSRVGESGCGGGFGSGAKLTLDEAVLDEDAGVVKIGYGVPVAAGGIPKNICGTCTGTVQNIVFGFLGLKNNGCETEFTGGNIDAAGGCNATAATASGRRLAAGDGVLGITPGEGNSLTWLWILIGCLAAVGIGLAVAGVVLKRKKDGAAERDESTAVGNPVVEKN